MSLDGPSPDRDVRLDRLDGHDDRGDPGDRGDRGDRDDDDRDDEGAATTRERLRRARWPLAVAAAVVVAALIGLLLLRPSGSAFLDPDSVAPTGGRAVVQVLRDHGVPVEVRTRFEQVASDLRGGADLTVVVARPDLLVGERTQDLRRAVTAAGADLVLVGAGSTLVNDLDLPLQVRPVEGTQVRDPGCGDDGARRAGTALTGGYAYRRQPGSDVRLTQCYLVGDGGTWTALTGAGGGRTTLVGSGRAFTNDELAAEGNAALAVGTLGAQPRVVWWTPSPLDTGVTAPPSLRDLVPGGVGWGLAQAVVAVLVALLWRGRRLGRLVTEPLPVVVRSVETTLGRGRLYRRARARGRAAQVLRVAAVRRLAGACSLPRTADPGTVAAAVAVRTGRPAPDVGALLVGPDPGDDAALVRLAHDLDDVEAAVRRA